MPQEGSLARKDGPRRSVVVLAVLVTAVVCTTLLEGGLAVTARLTGSPFLQPWGVSPAEAIRVWKLQDGHSMFGKPANSGGYHDDEFSPNKPPNTYRIVGLGDSFAVGIVPHAENYNTLLEEPAANGRPSIEILNHGVGATGPPEYAWIYQTEGRLYEHDAVMISVFLGNDFTQPNEPPDRRQLAGWYTYLALSRLMKLAVESGRRGSGTLQPRRPNEGPYSRDGYLDQGEWKSRLYRKQLKRHREKRFQRALDLIEEVVMTAKRPVLIPVFPDEIEVNDDFRREVFERFDLDERDYDFHGPARRVFEMTDRHPGATAIDLLPALREAERGGHTYALYNTHWNARGNRVVADALRPYVRALAERAGPD